MLRQAGNKVYRRFDKELLCIQPWGKNSFRVRSTVLGEVERCGSQFHQIMYSHMEEMKNLGKMQEGTDD